MEVSVPNNPRQVLRAHDPLQFNDIKQLKKAVMACGLHVPFTLSIFESLRSLNLTPRAWQQLGRATLSCVTFYLRRSEYQEFCTQIDTRNAVARLPSRNLDMLTWVEPIQGKWPKSRMTLQCMSR